MKHIFAILALLVSVPVWGAITVSPGGDGSGGPTNGLTQAQVSAALASGTNTFNGAGTITTATNVIAPGMTSFAIYPSTNLFPVITSDTNTYYVADAGTAAANGTYTLLGRDANREVWVKAGPRYVVHDIVSGSEDAAWVISAVTNTQSTFDEDYFSADGVTWEANTGTLPAPTTSYGTNNTTVIYPELTVTNANIVFGAGGLWGTNYYINQATGDDQRGRAGKYPFATLVAAISNANNAPVIFYVDSGIYTAATVLAPGQTVIGNGRSTVFRRSMTVTNNNTLRNFLLQHVSTTSDSSISLNGSCTNVLIDNVDVEGAIDGIYATAANANVPFVSTGRAVRSRFGSSWDSITFQGSGYSNYLNWTFEQCDINSTWNTNKLLAYGVTPGLTPLDANFIGVHGIITAFAGTNNQAYFTFKDCNITTVGGMGSNNCAIAANICTNFITLINTSIYTNQAVAGWSTTNFLAKDGGQILFSGTNTSYSPGYVALHAQGFTGNGLSLTNVRPNLGSNSVAVSGNITIYLTNQDGTVYRVAAQRIVP